ncbi:hypothetical protein [Brachyspira hyodysenteriae]|uniref:hypothetical protein n=1 Tax=Brachyspira hyodysenteriae TaxID=159 RepID=UPI0022CD970B|nr:hypothetical protein [Brachyspira hyodysenteriae]MCZ9963914.1 hypothetical protein [Brachyspira hyodysenteriae]
MDKLEASILNNYLINLSNKEYINDFLKKEKIVNDKNNVISFLLLFYLYKKLQMIILLKY